MKIEWHKVTWYSWTLAGIIFLIVIPLLTFYFVGQYQEIANLNIQSQINVQTSTTTNSQIKSVNDKLLSKDFLSNLVLVGLKGQYIGQSFCPNNINNQFYFSQCQISAEAVKKIDPITFKILKEPYYQDKNNVYVKIDGIETAYLVALDADPNTFKIMDVSFWATDFWATDKNNIYFGENKIIGSDPKSFKILNNSYAVDKNNAYFAEGSSKAARLFFQTIQNVDAATFHVISEIPVYAADKSHVYLGADIVSGADPSSFELIKTIRGLAKDNQSLFLNSAPIKNFDISKLSIKKIGKTYIDEDLYSVSDGNVSLLINDSYNGSNPSETFPPNDVQQIGELNLPGGIAQRSGRMDISKLGKVDTLKFDLSFGQALKSSGFLLVEWNSPPLVYIVASSKIKNTTITVPIPNFATAGDSAFMAFRLISMAEFPIDAQISNIALYNGNQKVKDIVWQDIEDVSTTPSQYSFGTLDIH